MPTLISAPVAVGVAVFLLLLGSGVPNATSGTESRGSASEYPTSEEVQENWPRFRGPGGLGVSLDTNIPSSWNGKTGEGILWKTAVPLPGHSSPVVWGDRVFLTGANKDKLEVYCIDANSGGLRWQRAVTNVPGGKPGAHKVPEDTGLAVPTPATDGKRVYAASATGDLVCFDLDGKPVWARHVGPLDNPYGHASSLLVYRDLLVAQLDQGRTKDKLSRLLAMKASTGEPVWTAERPTPSSWATPIVIDTGRREEIITCGNPWVVAYKPTTGEEFWRAKCLGGDVALSPVYADRLVFVANAMALRAAIRPGGRGDVTGSKLVWSVDDVAADICSPLVAHGLLFLLETGGYLLCYDAKTGKTVWEKDLGVGFMASPTQVGDRVYLLAEDGVMIIIKAGRKFNEVGRCELGEDCRASPAFLKQRIYIRGDESLYCIGQ